MPFQVHISSPSHLNLPQVQKDWAHQNNITITYDAFGLTENEFHAKTIQDCHIDHFGITDLIWINSTMIKRIIK